MRPEERLFAAIGQVDEAMLEQSAEAGRRGMPSAAVRCVIAAALAAVLLLSLAAFGIARRVRRDTEGVAEAFQAKGYMGDTRVTESGMEVTRIYLTDGLLDAGTLANGAAFWHVRLTQDQRPFLDPADWRGEVPVAVQGGTMCLRGPPSAMGFPLCRVSTSSSRYARSARRCPP